MRYVATHRLAYEEEEKTRQPPMSCKQHSARRVAGAEVDKKPVSAGKNAHGDPERNTRRRVGPGRKIFAARDRRNVESNASSRFNRTKLAVRLFWLLTTITGMCGRYTLRTPLNVLLSQFGAELQIPLDFRPRYNIAPTQTVLAVRQPEQGAKRELVALRWGLIPIWAKDTKIGYSTINARGDTVAEKPAFRAAFKKRRCLVLADGYFEWLKEGKEKQPFLYEIDGGQPFAFAGLWEYWPGPKDAKGKEIESCTIVTTDANKLASKVHDRTPVILKPDDYATWLDPSIDDRKALERLLVPFPVKRMTAWPVNKMVGNVKNKGPECIGPPA